jgi:hypothetical protein
LFLNQANSSQAKLKIYFSLSGSIHDIQCCIKICIKSSTINKILWINHDNNIYINADNDSDVMLKSENNTLNQNCRRLHQFFKHLYDIYKKTH